MICPYCVEYISAGSHKHSGCKIKNNKEFPPFYLDHHGREQDADPILLSVVGFGRHGKTVFLCSLFHYLDRYLPRAWRGFHSRVLDQESLSTLSSNRDLLEERKLPPRTDRSFPRPGIFRLTNMPKSDVVERSDLQEDTTLLIYDPPGEAFSTESHIVEFATFVKRSSCVLFLVDLKLLSESKDGEETLPGTYAKASQMEKLLETYVLSMRRMEIEKRSQHLIVVYTKADELKVSVPEFAALLAENPEFEAYLSTQLPDSLKNPARHLEKLDENSKLLEDFTANKLGAQKFINLTAEWFASVSYTAVSSLGAAPLKSVDEEGTNVDRLAVEISPRGVADPLLYVLAKSKRVRKAPPSFWSKLFTKVGLSILSSTTLLLIGMVYLFFFYNAAYRRAVACAEEQDYACAVQNYTRAIADYPKYAEAYSGRGWAFIEQGDYDAALADCNQALQLKTDFTEAQVCRGRTYSLRGDPENGWNDCNGAVEREPGYVAGFQCRGFIHWYQGRLDEAVRDYDRAIDLEPDARTYFSRAIAHADSNNQALSLKDQESANELGPATVVEVAKKEHIVAYYFRARASAARGENEPAISDFTKAITLAPSFIAAFEGRAMAYISLGKADLGIQDLTAVVTAMPNNPGIYVSRGNAYLQISDYDKAIIDFTKALDLNPDLVVPRFKRAFAQAKLGNYSEAIDDCTTVIDRQPTHTEAYFERGKAYLNRGDLQRDLGDYYRAVVDLRHAGEEWPDKAEPLYLSGLANARRRNYEEACADFANATERDPSLVSKKSIDYSGAFFDRGRLAKSQFDNNDNSEVCKAAYTRAIEDFNKAIALYPTRHHAAFAKINEMRENYYARCGY